MPRTVAVEEERRAQDISELKTIFPTDNRVVHVVSDPNGEANFYYWDPNGDPSTADGVQVVESSLVEFAEGGPNEGAWKKGRADVSALDGVDSISETAQDAVANALIAGDNVSITYDDVNDNLTIDVDPNVSTETRIDVDDSSTDISTEINNLDFGANLTVSNPTTGTALIDGIGDTRTNVSENGTQVVSETTDINFSSNLTVTDDGDGTVTVDATATVLEVQDSGTSIESSTSTINFSNLLDVTNPTSGTVGVTVNSDVSQYDLSSVTTDDISEGSNNEYYTSTKVRNELSASGDIGYDSSTGEFSLDISALSASDLFGTKTTDDLPEGTANLYYTDQRAKDAVGGITQGGTDITVTYDTGTDTLTVDHDDTGGASNNTTADTFVENIQFDGRGHVTSITSSAVDSTTSQSFLLDSSATNPVRIKNDGGELQVRNGDDTAYNDLRVSNLTVEGTQTIVNTETVEIADNIFELNSDLTTSESPSENAGITVNRGADSFANLLWNESGDYWMAGIAGNETQLATIDESLSTFNNDFTTDDISEGSNLYFTDERAQDAAAAALTGGDNTTVSYNDGSNTITINSLGDEAIQDAVYNNVLSGSQDLIDVTYDDANDQVNYVVQSDLSQYDNSTAGFLTDLSGFTTDDLSEGTSNLYYSDSKVDDEVNSLLTEGTNITLTYDSQASTLTIDSATNLSIEDSTTSVATNIDGLDFGSNLNVTDNGDGSVTVDSVSPPSTSVSDNGTQVIAEPTDINFGANISVTDDGDGTVTVDGDAVATSVSNEGTEVLAEPTDINFGPDLTASDDGDGTITVTSDIDLDTAVFSGDGVTTEFEITHGIGSTPTSWTVHPTSDDASGISHTNADSTTITVIYDSAPPSGTDNLTMNYVYKI